MGKKKVASASVDEVVTAALVELATADSTRRLTGKGDPPALFPSKSGANKDAIEKCLNSEPPLIAVSGTGKTETVRLTAAGFELALSRIPEDKVVGAARSFAAELPPASRVEFLNAIVRGSPLATAELLPLLGEALAAEKIDSEGRLAAAATRREAEQAQLRAIEQWKSMLEKRRQQRIETLKREFLVEGAEPPEVIEAVPPREPETERRPDPHVAGLRPTSADDVSFQRDLAGGLVSAWLETWRLDKPSERLFLETAMGNIRGLRQIGEVGEQVQFAGEYQECDQGVPTGTPVRIIRPGWVLSEDDREHLLLPARVSK